MVALTRENVSRRAFSGVKFSAWKYLVEGRQEVGQAKARRGGEELLFVPPNQRSSSRQTLFLSLAALV